MLVELSSTVGVDLGFFDTFWRLIINFLGAQDIADKTPFGGALKGIPAIFT